MGQASPAPCSADSACFVGSASPSGFAGSSLAAFGWVRQPSAEPEHEIETRREQTKARMPASLARARGPHTPISTHSFAVFKHALAANNKKATSPKKPPGNLVTMVVQA